jgi:hypothetical protein
MAAASSACFFASARSAGAGRGAQLAADLRQVDLGRAQIGQRAEIVLLEAQHGRAQRAQGRDADPADRQRDRQARADAHQQPGTEFLTLQPTHKDVHASPLY